MAMSPIWKHAGCARYTRMATVRVRTSATNVSAARQLASTASAWAWTVACVILIALRIYPGFTPYLANDSCYSFIVHFDAERSFGVVPAPVVTFPMGFPLVIALISRLGVPPETAASLISILLYSARMYDAELTSVVFYACACSYHSPAFVGD
jgi:hypothetical protein